jgi:hypothetical protein
VSGARQLGQQLRQRHVRVVHPRARAREIVQAPRVGDVLAREEHHREASSRLQDTSRLGKRLLGRVDVVEHRDEHRCVEAVRLERKLASIRRHRLETLGSRVREHLGRAIDDDRFPTIGAERERVVSRTSPDVGQSRSRRSGERAARNGSSTDGLAARVASYARACVE